MYLYKNSIAMDNNGVESRLFKTDPGEGWIKGLVPRKRS